MAGTFLIQAAVFLAAAAIAAPLARKLHASSVLGYLAAGMLIGPYGLGFVYAVYEVENILHFAEQYGVALLLFLIGLELRSTRLRTMRGTVFGLGAAQVVLTSALLMPVAAYAFGIGWDKAVFVALALSLSSTAFVLQILEEKGELTSRHGRATFSVLLFQDLAAIPLIALVPLLAHEGRGLSLLAVGEALAAIAIVVVVGRYALSGIYRLVASAGGREAMTATALLTVVGVALLMEAAGLSAALGAFLAGVLLADSPYRHQIEADIAPFEGLLLGLFFTAVGMALDLHLLTQRPLMIAAAVLGLLTLKACVIFPLGRWQGLDAQGARRLALALSQGGEFAFVLFATALGENVIDSELAALLTLVVTLSMLATPLLLLADSWFAARPAGPERDYDAMPDKDGHVIIAGFGRFGQIVARILRARGIPFTALENSARHVDFATRFGSRAYYGDASRLDILQAAQTGRARAFVLAIDDIDASLRTAEIVRRHFPHVPIYARARDRLHVHKLMDLGVEAIRRETFLAALDLSREVLEGLSFSSAEAERTIATFSDFDRARLREDYDVYTDAEKVREKALTESERLEKIFNRDTELVRDAEREKKDG